MTPSQLRAAEYFTPGSPLYRKPSLVRVDGAKSSVLGAATSVVERFKYWVRQGGGGLLAGGPSGARSLPGLPRHLQHPPYVLPRM
jgi:hypothetical protein